MEKILLTTGLACLIAGIIGGGLKAFGIEIPVLKTWPRQLVLIFFGGLLCFMAINMSPKPAPQKKVLVPKQEILINFAQQGGPFIELGKAKKHPRTKHYWYAMDIRVESQCTKAIHIDPVNFSLYVSSTSSTTGAKRFRPETIIKYNKMLKAGWLEPKEATEGSLVFEVPRKLQNGIDSNGAYLILRSHFQTQCDTSYKPY